MGNFNLYSTYYMEIADSFRFIVILIFYEFTKMIKYKNEKLNEKINTAFRLTGNY